MNLYTSVFAEKTGAENSKVMFAMQYGKGMEPDKEGAIQYASFLLNGQEFSAMDSAHKHRFSFNEAISFIIPCETQEEIDYFWEKLSADPSSEQCGWLKDTFGLSWQVTARIMDEMMEKGNTEQVKRLTQAFLQMKKFDITALKDAFEGK